MHVENGCRPHNFHEILKIGTRSSRVIYPETGEDRLGKTDSDGSTALHYGRLSPWKLALSSCAYLPVSFVSHAINISYRCNLGRVLLEVFCILFDGLNYFLHVGYDHLKVLK